MLKNALVLIVTITLCGALLWWAAPRLQPVAADLPGYGELVAYDPDRAGGHLKPAQDLVVRGSRVGEGVRWITNAQGYRNEDVIAPEPAPGTLRILFYGDSFVDGMRTDQDATIGRVLERLLEAERDGPVEVIISGHNNLANAWYHWQQFGHQLKPQVVLLGLTVGNDLTSHNFGAGVLPVAESLDRLVEVDRAAPMAGVGSATAMIPADGFLAVSERSAIGVKLAALNDATARRFGFLAHRAAPAMGPRPGRPGTAHAAGFFISLGLFYAGEIPFIEAVWSDFETLLPGFVAQLRHHDARPLLVAFPTRIEALERDWDRLKNALQLDPERFDRNRAMARINELCEAIELACLDTRAALRAGERDGEVFLPLGDMHLSPHGQAVVAAALSSFVVDHLAARQAERPGDDWLASYRERIASWAQLRLRLEAPWLDPGDGSARLTLAAHFEALGSMLTAGWRANEPGDPYWSAGGAATIRIPVARPGADLRLTLNAKPFLAEANGKRQRVVVRIGDQVLADWRLDDDAFAPRSVVLPAAALRAPWTSLDLTFPDAIVPSEHGISGDRRQLGIAVIGVALAPAL